MSFTNENTDNTSVDTQDASAVNSNINNSTTSSSRITAASTTASASGVVVSNSNNDYNAAMIAGLNLNETAQSAYFATRRLLNQASNTNANTNQVASSPQRQQQHKTINKVDSLYHQDSDYDDDDDFDDNDNDSISIALLPPPSVVSLAPFHHYYGNSTANNNTTSNSAISITSFPSPGGIMHNANSYTNTFATNSNASLEPNSSSSSPTSNLPAVVALTTPMRGHHALFRALERLEGWEREEAVSYESCPLTQYLTEILANNNDTNTATFDSPSQALETLAHVGQAVPRRVCQRPFRKNDIVWVCRTCQADETCVLCHACFSESKHDGHDVAFYHAQAGGCCDCGDPDAWDPAGFCPHHGPPRNNLSLGGNSSSQASISDNVENVSGLPAGWVSRIQGIVPAAIDWMVETIAKQAKDAHTRARTRYSTTTLSSTFGTTPNIATRGQQQRLRDDNTVNGSAMSNVNRTNLNNMTDGAFSNNADMDTTTNLTILDALNNLAGDTDNSDLPPPPPPPPLHMFSPTFAGGNRSTRSLDSANTDNTNNTTSTAVNVTSSVSFAEAALELGRLGSQQQGLYIVLQADDIHATSQWVDVLRDFWGPSNYFNDTLLGNLVKALRQHGQLVIWGTMELVAEIGVTQVQLWMDNDTKACSTVGALVLDRARRLTQHGVYCAIVTRRELWQQPRAVVVLQWLSAVARSCDPLCQTVAESLQPERHLVPLLEADFKMSARVTKAWYSLLLTLLAVPTFKSHLAAAYCDTYRSVTSKYARGMGVLERSGYTLSVQFLNRVTYVVDLVQSRDLLGKLGQSLLDTLLVARPPHSKRLDSNHFVMTHRRYSPCLSDLKCVLNVPGMPRLFAARSGTFLHDWLESLSVAQCMDPQEWRHWTQGHVEDESRGWVGAFNASISLGSLFERLLSWEDDESSPLEDRNSPLSQNLMTCVELTQFILQHGVNAWQQKETKLYHVSSYTSLREPHRFAPAALPMSTVAARHGTAVAMSHLPIAQITPFSFHLPLHRFAAGCIRELCLRSNDIDLGMTKLMQLLSDCMSSADLNALWSGLMEFPVLVLSRAAQIRAGMWRRNGPGLNDQVLNYAEPPFCRTMRDADLLMMQFATLGRSTYQRSIDTLSVPTSDVGMSLLVHLLLHRLGVFEFVGLMKAPNVNIDKYRQEISQGYYSAEPKGPDSTDDEVILPWSYALARDAAASLILVEEFLHLIIIFASELPHAVPLTKEDLVHQARWRIHREIVHRLASGPKTHSELSEVHHVLSHRDNALLGDEGKKINPDDASGAVLGSVLNEVAVRNFSRAKLEPDKWELKNDAWNSYDPSFYHICLRSHQTAAEGRPKPVADTTAPFGWKAKAYAPQPAEAHPFFERLRRDAICDATVLAVVYRILHLHCREDSGKSLADMPGRSAYENKERSETSLARVVHLLTLGAYAWNNADADDNHWREKGGGSAGSVFFDRNDSSYAPVARDWILKGLLVDPADLLNCEWYQGEENMLLLLRRLALSGGGAGGFTAHDNTVRSGAAWLCDFASNNCSDAARILRPTNSATLDGKDNEQVASKNEIDERRKKAKEAAMAKMKAQAAKFATMMDIDIEEKSVESESNLTLPPMTTPKRATRASSFASTVSAASTTSGSFTPPTFSEEDFIMSAHDGIDDATNERPFVSPRLLKDRPRCIICNDEDCSESRTSESSAFGENQRKRSRRKNENALGFVGYVQASTVLKGGGGPPPDLNSPMSPVKEFVGVHVAFCGHAVHSECCESYLATVLHRDDRAIGKREEFKCPLCQRLSNCLIPFIDVAADWVELSHSTSLNMKLLGKSDKDDDNDSMEIDKVGTLTLNDYLNITPWWITRHCKDVFWDGQSAFVETPSANSNGSDGDIVLSKLHHTTVGRKEKRRGVRSLKKKDLYAAWTAMMRTPRLVRRRLRARGSETNIEVVTLNNAVVMEGALQDGSAHDHEETAGETVVWRRYMDQVFDLSYRADSKRLGDDHLHDLFGEFRHYIVEKHAYNMANRLTGGFSMDWPACMYNHFMTDTARQILSREKLLSKLLLSIQSFTYSCCCEMFEAKRMLWKSYMSGKDVANHNKDNSIETIYSKFGISGMACDGTLIMMAKPTREDDGTQPFNGRLGRLRYLALAIMAAAGAVSADLVQLVLAFPVKTKKSPLPGLNKSPDRAPVAYPILHANILTHVVVALCATCGRARARSDALEIVWASPFSSRGSFAFSDDTIKQQLSVEEDCENFIKLGLIARTLQVLLGAMKAPLSGYKNPQNVSNALLSWLSSFEAESASTGIEWTRACVKLLCTAIYQPTVLARHEDHTSKSQNDLEFLKTFPETCSLAAEEAASFLANSVGIMQVLLPGVLSRYEKLVNSASTFSQTSTSDNSIDLLFDCLGFESLEEMLQSHHTQVLVSHWYNSACEQSRGNTLPGFSTQSTLKQRLHRTQGFHCYDWPSAGSFDGNKIKTALMKMHDKESQKAAAKQEISDSVIPGMPSPMKIENVRSTSLTSTSEGLRGSPTPRLATFISKKTVPLLGGFMSDSLAMKLDSHPRVAVIPTSYTDLYAELGTLLPDCEQIAVCLVCGEVLNAAGKGECTRHSYKCGAGAGMFFLLQECSGLIMHKSKAAYIHSPYVDIHGETPQYRGRPLNLDLDRYEHLREVWYGHAVRQQVVAERGSSRQVILPDFY